MHRAIMKMLSFIHMNTIKQHECSFIRLSFERMITYMLKFENPSTHSQVLFHIRETKLDSSKHTIILLLYWNLSAHEFSDCFEYETA